MEFYESYVFDTTCFNRFDLSRYDIDYITIRDIADIMVEKTDNNTSFVINETARANSLEQGKASFRHKIYYDTPENLLIHINKLKELGLFEEVAN